MNIVRKEADDCMTPCCPPRFRARKISSSQPRNTGDAHQQIPGQIADSRLLIQSITLSPKCNNTKQLTTQQYQLWEQELGNVGVISNPPGKHYLCRFPWNPSTGPGPFSDTSVSLHHGPYWCNWHRVTEAPSFSGPPLWTRQWLTFHHCPARALHHNSFLFVSLCPLLSLFHCLFLPVSFALSLSFFLPFFWNKTWSIIKRMPLPHANKQAGH